MEPVWWSSELIPTFLHRSPHLWKHTTWLTSWLLLLGLLSDSLTRDDLMSARSPSSSEWLSSAKICSLCGSPSSLNGIISSVAHSSGSPPPPDNWGIVSDLLSVCFAKKTEDNTHTPALSRTTERGGGTPTKIPRNRVGNVPCESLGEEAACEHAAGVFSLKQQEKCGRCRSLYFSFSTTVSTQTDPENLRRKGSQWESSARLNIMRTK